MRAITAVALAIMLSGCVSRNAEIRAGVDGARAECRANAQAGKFRTWVDAARCLNAAEAPLAQVQGHYPDLWNVKFATRTAIAEKVDRGEMTAAQAELAEAEANHRLVSEMERRGIARRAVAAQEAASAPIRCSRVGQTVSCY